MISFIVQLFSTAVFYILSVVPNQKFPQPLSPAVEREYFRKMTEDGDSKARDALIEHNLRLVAHIVRKYYSTCKNEEDILSIGTIGLIKAVDSFDVKNGARFATYAAKCIQNEILMYLRSQKKVMCEVSINEAVDMDKDGNPLTYIDIISCEDTVCEDLDRKIKSERIIEYIKRHLSGREKEIIVLRYGLNGDCGITQREVAAKLGISRSYVSRIEKSALEKIHKYIG